MLKKLATTIVEAAAARPPFRAFVSCVSTVCEQPKNNMDKMGKIFLALIGRGNDISVKYIHSFVLACSML